MMPDLIRLRFHSKRPLANDWSYALPFTGGNLDVDKIRTN